jgi:excisionase family DNA binding protein
MAATTSTARRPFLTLDEFCEITRLTKPTVRKHIAAGLIEAFRAGPSSNAGFRFHPDEPQNYLERMRIQPAISA